MYKQQKFLNVSSTIWALVVTAIVLLIASSANAQDMSVVDTSSPVTTNEQTSNDSMSQSEETSPADSQPEAMPVTQTEEDSVTLNTTSSSSQNRSISTTTEASTTLKVSTNRVTTVEERRAAIAERRAALQQKRVALQNATSTRNSVLRETAQNRITSGISQIAVTLNRAIVSQKNINTHLQTKAIELQEKGSDTTSIQTGLKRASELLALAEEALGGIDINARYAASSKNPRADWTSVREQASEVADLLREAREIMRNNLSMLRTQLQTIE